MEEVFYNKSGQSGQAKLKKHFCLGCHKVQENIKV